jgi:hypothetical protein
MGVGGDDHRPPFAFAGVQGRLQSLAVGGEPQPEQGWNAGPWPARALLGALASLSHLTRLTSLTVHALNLWRPSSEGDPEGYYALAWDVLWSLPPGLKKVGPAP